MPYRLDTHVLTVYASVIRKVNTSLLSHLYETFVVDKEDKTAPTTQTLPQKVPSESPSLAKSIEASEGMRQLLPQSLRRTAVVHSFSLSQIHTPRTIYSAAQPSDAIPKPLDTGDDCDPGQSHSHRNSSILINKKPVLQIGGSSEECDRLQSSKASSRPGSLLTQEAAGDPDADDYIDESAIDDDDDSSDWEDSMEESGKSSMDDKFFQ
ncbi:hypothetical protein FANTH_7915 [Fusarium anthophilum]|uniref:DUF3295 domain-containing protein n=1 Tax=Fusarium anthophilum TaxID=48485 RepID=A0A8H4ZC32_9HYPO|nr:hypothetical protein FANTH_7915 [Fusarium anthophilum]